LPASFALCAVPILQDEYWTNLVLGMIGETIDAGDEICGARVVDKSVGSRCTYRLELWFRKNDEKIANELLGACPCLRAPDALRLGRWVIAWAQALRLRLACAANRQLRL
jgi:hypothetical protein